jgi:hypothetical protein
MEEIISAKFGGGHSESWYTYFRSVHGMHDLADKHRFGRDQIGII